MRRAAAAGELQRERTLELLSLVAAGDQRAFAELFRSVNRSVYWIALQRLRNHEDASDICQETAEEIWKHPERFRGQSRFNTYVLQIALNKATDRLRRRGRESGEQSEELDEIVDEDPTPFDALVLRQDAAELRRCIDRLPDHQRMALLLTYFDDLSSQEAADVLGCSAGLVRSRVFHALKNLKALLGCAALADAK